MQRVIDEMAKAKGDIEKRYREKIPEIIRECMAFAYLGKTFTFDASPELNDRVNKRLIELSDEILSDIEGRAKKVIKYAEEEDDEDVILAYMEREQNGEDLITRIDKHNSNFRYFLEGWIAIGLVNSIPIYELTNEIMTHMHNVYLSWLWQDAFKQGYLSDAIRTQGYHFGKGIMKNPITALTELERHSINTAFQYGRFKRFQKDGAIGYTIHRNSGFDCPYCDSYTGIIHPMTESLLPLHPRCVCFSRPVYREDTADWELLPMRKGLVSIHRAVNKNDSDYKDILDIATYFATQGSRVLIPPKKTWDSTFNYDQVYSSLKGTPFYGKCPDLNIDGLWYEFEGFKTTNPKNAFRNMMNHGLKQSNRLIIKDPGLSREYIKASVRKRIYKDGQDIKELWIKGERGLERIF